MKNEWNADNYTDNFNFVYEYGTALCDLITVPKGSVIIDLGCGNGTLTQKLAEKGFCPIGIDSSAKMLKKAESLYPDLHFMLGDACSFELEEKADAIFSNAVFHWIDNHELLFKNISNNLKIGGELVFEFGGKGCVQTVHSALGRAFEEYGLSYKNNFNFRSIGELAPLLERNGFRVEYASLFDRPTPLKGENGLENWINMFITSAFYNVDAEVKNDIIARTVEICKPKLCKKNGWIADYVRIRMKAVKTD